MLFKPYYLVQAYSDKMHKQQTQFIPNELAQGNELMDPVVAKQRSISYAISLNEIKSMNAEDWKPIVRLMSDAGDFLVDLDSIQ
jgi:hypothetical protein